MVSFLEREKTLFQLRNFVSIKTFNFAKRYETYFFIAVGRCCLFCMSNAGSTTAAFWGEAPLFPVKFNLVYPLSAKSKATTPGR